MDLSIRISGLESIDEDFKAFQSEVSAAVRGAMDGVGERMKDALKRHIEQDVYEAYTPKVYQRRSENLLLGTPLNNMDANTYIFNKGAGVTLDYLPTGDHAVAKWSGADGDALVGRIEKKSPPYNWGDDQVPERPFFQNFTDEMTDGGALARYFAEAMLEQGVIVEEDGSGVVRDGEDGAY